MGAPEYVDFLALAERFEEVRLDTTMVFTDFFEVDAPYPRDLLGRLADLQPKVLLGSDFPTIPYAYAHQLEALARLDLGDDWLRAVCWENGAGSSGPSRPPMEGDAAGSEAMSVAVVVDAPMVEAAQRHGVGKVAGTAATPRISMVELAPGERPFTSVRPAGRVTGRQRDPLVLGEQSAGAAQVQREARPAQDCRNQPRAAGQAPQLTRGDDVTGVDPCDAHRGGELVVIEGDHHRGAVLACSRSVGRCSISSTKASPAWWAQSPRPAVVPA